MFKMIIVDDEALVRKGIKTTIDWEELDVQIVGEARNGVEALSIIERNQTDLVITDIRMPIMDGLKLSENITQKYPKIKIIVLSGYDEFEYARKALKYGVHEYLLKPISIEHLTNTIKGLCQQITCERNKTNQWLYSERLIDENLPYIRSSFFNKIPGIINKNDEKVSLKAEKMGFYLDEPNSQIALIDIDDFFLITEGLSDCEIAELKMSIMNIAEKLLREVFKCTLFYNDSDYITCILYINSSDQYLVKDICKEIQFCVKKYLKLTVTIALGNICSDIKIIKDSYRQANMALKAKAFMGKDEIIYYANVEDEISDDDLWKVENISSISQDIGKLMNAIYKMDIRMINQLIDNILKLLLENNRDFFNIKHQLIKILVITIFSIEKSGIQLGERFDNLSNLYEEINIYETMDDVERWIKRIYRDIIKIVDNCRNDRYKKIIKKALDYVNENYCKNILIEDITSQIYITPNYFSRVFKEEMGENFVTWLNKYRVDKAKQFLKEKNLKIYEVAEKVGFNDYRYFNKIFRRYSGCSPMEYKKTSSNTTI